MQKTFPTNSLFSPTSHFDPLAQDDDFDFETELDELEARLADTQRKATITLKQAENWALDLQAMADEAHDERLLALESKILDLRDEILAVLHNAI